VRISISSYDEAWSRQFEIVKEELASALFTLNPVIEHIGSTSVTNLSAKPIIDILVGIQKESDLNASISPLLDCGYLFYEVFNDIMPYRRFFAKLKKSDAIFPSIFTEKTIIPEELNELKLAHIHILSYNSYHWMRHIAFREYLRSHSEILQEYQELKIVLSQKDWKDGSEYNAAKNLFIKNKEADAIKWYSQR
jgi:GrpB-like predicted nucleotidyltransferase (UPF0157 family)